MCPSKYKCAQISSRCSLTHVVERLKNCLHHTNLAIFRQSCFGHFLDLPENKFLAQLAFHTLKKMRPGYKQTAIFYINEREVTFSPKDFFLITGLRFSGEDVVPERSEIHENIFGGSEEIYLHNIEDVFLTVCRSSDGRGIMSLKLGLLWFVCAVLFGRNPHRCRINLKYMHLVDNLEKFYSYPWGLKAYDFFISNLCRARKALENGNPRDISLDMYGLTFALQVWLFESAPSLGKFCGTRIDRAETVFPRILRWSVTRIKWYSTLSKFFNGNGSINMEPLVPCPTEEAMLLGEIPHFPKSAREVVFPQPTPNIIDETDDICLESEINATIADKAFGYNLRSREKTETHKNGAGIMDSTLHHDEKIRQSELSLYLELKEMLSKMGTKIDFLVTCLSHKRRKMVNGVSLDAVGGLEDILPLEFSQSPSLGYKTPFPTKGAIKEVGSSSQLNATNGGAFSKHEMFKFDEGDEFTQKICGSGWFSQIGDLLDVDSEMANGRRGVGGTPSDPVSLSTDNEVEGGKHSSKENTSTARCLDFNEVSKKMRRPCTSAHDPVQLASPIILDRFDAWLVAAEKKTRKELLLVPVGEGVEVHCGLLRKLRDCDQWISNVVCDAVLLTLVLKRKHNPDQFMQNWTIVDSHCSSKMMATNYKQALKTLKPYTTGKLPKDDGRKWQDVDHIYGVCLVMKIHWVAYDIQLRSRRIVVYDSMTRINNWATIKKEMAELLRFVEFQTNITNASVESKIECDDAPWELVMYGDAPQQINSADCGVFALKFLECLVTGNPVDIINPGDGPQYRQSFCAMLFELATTSMLEI